MNSIRESCKSLEELDLGGNKLNDLIEVYKILQCTPNLRFLNLSENDLSRSSPVAMASSAGNNTSFSATSSSLSSYSHSSATVQPASTMSTSFWTANSAVPQQRDYLAPINQNQQQQNQANICIRRHSSLGQASASNSVSTNSSAATSTMRQPVSRVAEARRLAAAAAVAQSKKTSSALASKLTDSAAAQGDSRSNSSSRRASREASGAEVRHRGDNKARGITGPVQRHAASPASTMHLARSLSSLSAKDVRAASSSLSRISSTHRSSIQRKEHQTLRGTTSSQRQQQQQQHSLGRSQSADSSCNNKLHPTVDNKNLTKASALTSASQKLYVEPIAETDDVDMGEQQQVSPTGASSSPGDQQQQQQQPSAHPQLQTKALALQTGNQATTNNTSKSSHSSSVSLTAGGQSSPNFRRTFESIKALALNNTGCQWRVVCSILSRMPYLEELHLSLNNYERIDLDPNEFKHYSLKRLYLCNNPKLTNWEELDKLLVAFPSLEALSIADCSISQIPENLDRAREWRKLCGLNINGWPIKEWPVVERLNQLPSLIDLRCRNLEVLNSIDEPRHHLIARLPKLQRLNGSEIEEREHAEKAFLRFFMANSHLERPSRFHELVQIHGEIIPVDVDVDLSPPSQARVRVIYLNRNHYRKENEDDIMMSEDFLTKLMDTADPSTSCNTSDNMELSELAQNTPPSSVNDEENHNKPIRLFKDEGQEVVAIEVDLRQSVRKFKSTLAALFGLGNQNLILYYIDHEMVGLMGPELIKHNQKKLWNYNVQDGDQFIVEER